MSGAGGGRAVGYAALAALPFFLSSYFQHLAVQIVIWSLVYTGWALMGRFRLTSLGHGAFLGVGAYVPTLLWNNYGVTPWLGIPAAMALAILLAMVVGYPCFRLKVVGHYFALVTLALGQVVLLVIVAAREITGGSLGMTPRALGGALYAQYLMYLNPESMSGVGISLQIVFAAIAGGMYSMFGPTVGACFTILLNEGLRVLFGTHFVGAANTIYGALLVVFIIFMPRGIVGLAERHEDDEHDKQRAVD